MVSLPCSTWTGLGAPCVLLLILFGLAAPTAFADASDTTSDDDAVGATKRDASRDEALESEPEGDEERGRERAKRLLSAAPRGYLFGAEFYVSDVADRALLASGFGYALTAQYRWKRSWVLGVRVEHDVWTRFELGHGVDPGAISAALVASRLGLSDRVRTSLMLGPSFLLFNTGLDDAGSVGLYAEARPLGVLFHFKHLSLALEPFTLALVAPVLRQIPLVRVSYRSVVQLEFGRRR